MKKSMNNLDEPELKHLFAQDSISPLVVSKAGNRRNKSLKPIGPKGLAAADCPKNGNGVSGSGARTRSRRSRKSVKGFESNEMGFLASQHARKRSANKANIFVRLGY